MLRQYELVEKVRAYDPDADEAMINRAYVFSMKAHGSQTRASGDHGSGTAKVGVDVDVAVGGAGLGEGVTVGVQVGPGTSSK